MKTVKDQEKQRGILYVPTEDLKYEVSTKDIGLGSVQITFSCNGGKHGTDEIIDVIEINVLSLLNLLRENQSE